LKKLASGLGDEDGQNKRKFLLRNGRIGEGYDRNGEMVMSQFQKSKKLPFVRTNFKKKSLFILTESPAG
jgi:hypothetical protein